MADPKTQFPGALSFRTRRKALRLASRTLRLVSTPDWLAWRMKEQRQYASALPVPALEALGRHQRSVAQR